MKQNIKMLKIISDIQIIAGIIMLVGTIFVPQRLPLIGIPVFILLCGIYTSIHSSKLNNHVTTN